MNVSNIGFALLALVAIAVIAMVLAVGLGSSI